jgi:hypothetical protein
VRGKIANWTLQNANCKLNESRRIVRPLGRKMMFGFPATQGDALGWENVCPFGANKDVIPNADFRDHTDYFAQPLFGKAKRTIFVMIFILLSFTGCGTRFIEKTDSAKSSGIQTASSVVERGPVKVTAEIQPAKARLSDEPVLTLTIDSVPGVEIEKPPFGEALGRFKILDTREPLPRTREGREIVQKILTLEPTTVGRFAIDPISVSFRDKRPGADEKSQSLATKPLTVEISSSYEKETPSLDDLHAAADPVALSWRIPAWVWAVGTLVMAFAAMGIWLWRRRKREKAALAIVLSPEDLARRELQKLADSGWMETNVKIYFVELTAIVRRYIERTIGIRAPEQTTEEFLREISRAGATAGLSSSDGFSSGLGTAGQASSGTRLSSVALKNFLESADLVKFAAHRPRREDIEESFRRAETFVGQRVPHAASSPEEALA